MVRRTTRSTRTDTLVPYPPLFLSLSSDAIVRPGFAVFGDRGGAGLELGQELPDRLVDLDRGGEEGESERAGDRLAPNQRTRDRGGLARILGEAFEAARGMARRAQRFDDPALAHQLHPAVDRKCVRWGKRRYGRVNL